VLLAKHWPVSATQQDFIAAFKIYPAFNRDFNQIYVLEDNNVVSLLFRKDDGQQVKSQPLDLSSNALHEWQNMGLIEIFSTGKTMTEVAQEIRKVTAKSPIRVIDKVIVELTGLCNLNCQRCFRGGARPSEYGLPVDLLKDALRPLLLTGVPHVLFSGGEPTIRRRDLLDLVGFVKDYMLPGVVYKSDKREDAMKESIGILSNGTFDEPEEFIGQLKEIGNIWLRVSLASFDEISTDQESGVSGVHARIKDLVRIAKKVGFPLGIMAHDIGESDSAQAKTERAFFEENCQTVLDGNVQAFQKFGSAALTSLISVANPDPLNYFGRLAPTKDWHRPGWCKCLYEPHRLHIRPQGNVGPCLYTYQLDEEYGNLHERSMVEILNQIETSPINRLFAQGAVEQAQFLVDTSLFPGPFSKPCEAMTISLTFAQLYAKYLAKGIPKEEAQHLANEQTAILTGYKR